MTTPNTELNPDSIRAIMEAYGLKAVSSQKIRKVFRVQTPDGEFALKPTQTAIKDIEFIQSVLLFLSAKGFPVDPFIPASDSHCYTVHDGIRYLVSPWFYGEEADFHRLSDLMTGVKLMARFHIESQGFPIHSVPSERRYWRRWFELFDLRIRQMETFYCLSKLRKESFDRLYHRYLPYFLHQAQEALAELLISPYPWIVAQEECRSYLCHHDFSSRNLLLNTCNCRLLDLDYCIADLRLHDLANLLLRLLRHDAWKSARARFALQIYHRQYPLSEENLRVLHTFLRWPQDYWQIGLQYYIERLPWPNERFMRTLNKKIADEPLRQRFLSEFPTENGIRVLKMSRKIEKAKIIL